MLKRQLITVIKANERVMKTSMTGNVKFIDGPKFIFHPLSKVTNLKLIIASPTNYIKIVKNTGQSEFIKGPVAIFENLLEHKSIECEPMLDVKHNESLCVYSYNKNGIIENNVLQGPCKYVPTSSDFKFEEIKHITIPENQYLRIEYIDGKIEHLKGPNIFSNDKRYIKNVELCFPIYIESNELIVTHSVNKETNTLTRNIIKGKHYYIPNSNETVHKFSWSGTKFGSKFHTKVSNQLNFTVLRDMPQQTYYDIVDVRTADHVLINIKMLLFFEIVNIEKMIDKTNDPICNVTTETSSCIMKIISNMTFDEFKSNIKNMNDVKLYSNLQNLEEQLGIRVNKVNMLGYDAPEILQKIHNDALQEKTKIELTKEIIQSEEANKTFQLKEESKRNQSLIDLQMEKTKAEIEQLRQKQNFELEKSQQCTNSEIEKLSKLKNIGVDISTYLSKADKSIEIKSSSPSNLLINPLN